MKICRCILNGLNPTFNKRHICNLCGGIIVSTIEPWLATRKSAPRDTRTQVVPNLKKYNRKKSKEQTKKEINNL